MTALVLSVLALIGAEPPPPLSDEALQHKLAGVASPDPAARLAAVEAVAKLPPEAMPVMAKRLAKPRLSSADTFRRLFLEMWAQVPNWKGTDPMWIQRPEPVWNPPPRVKGQPRQRRPPPHDPETLDWVKALSDLDLASPGLVTPEPPFPPESSRPSPSPDGARKGDPPPPPVPPTPAELALARTEALETVALLRGISASKRMDAVEPLFKVAFENEGVFRDEVGRQIRAMESYAVPSLIRLMHQRGPAALNLGKQRRYASYQLDRMDRARPSKAISSAPDDRVRSAIIHQYGEDKALEAVEAILEQVDAPSHRVRKEARWAWLRYVTGKAPPPAPKRKRKLGGGREETQEKADYLTYREIAELAVQRKVAEVTGAPADPKAGPKALTDQLFAWYDQRHAAEWDQEFAAAHEQEERGELKAAVDEYGWILTHDPNYARRGEMAHAFVRLGDQLRAQRQAPQALGVYRQAVDLDPAGPEAPYARARVALLDALEHLQRGHADPSLFRRALSLDPSLAEAREGLARAEALRGRKRWLEGGEAALATAALLVALWWLWRRTAPRDGQAPTI